MEKCDKSQKPFGEHLSSFGTALESFDNTDKEKLGGHLKDFSTVLVNSYNPPKELIEDLKDFDTALKKSDDNKVINKVKKLIKYLDLMLKNISTSETRKLTSHLKDKYLDLMLKNISTSETRKLTSHLKDFYIALGKYIYTYEEKKFLLTITVLKQ